MGHYCWVCGRTRSNEKFSGKGHKNHVCKDCSGKSGKKAKNSMLNEGNQAVDDLDSLFGALVDSEQTSSVDSWFYEGELEIRRSDDGDDEGDDGEFEFDGNDEEDDGEFEIVGIEEDDFEFEGSDDGYEDIPF